MTPDWLIDEERDSQGHPEYAPLAVNHLVIPEGHMPSRLNKDIDVPAQWIRIDEYLIYPEMPKPLCCEDVRTASFIAFIKENNYKLRHHVVATPAHLVLLLRWPEYHLEDGGEHFCQECMSHPKYKEAVGLAALASM